MTDPPPAPDDRTAPERRAWETQIESLLESYRRYSDAGPPPAWLARATQPLAGLVHASIVAHTEQATSTIRAQLTEEGRRRTQAEREPRQLRGAVRTYLAEIIGSGSGIDRHDANDALRGWGLDPLPARFTVSLTATIATTLVADDADETVTVTELHTDEVVEHDELPDPVALG